MTFDPYRVLGVDRTTPIAEVKRAYRRLAKENHPDSAGPGALRRFLEIQAAYEEIVEGKPRTRPPGGGAEPAWRADPERARATREAWRRRSTRADTASGGRRSRGTTGAAGTPPGSDDAGAPGGSRRSRGAGPKRATPGSTTYDEAANEPFDPAWGGASWYGPSSGTYWTINPKEYADPRKHGPEYQARARRAAAATGLGTDGDADAARANGAPSEPAASPDPSRPAGATGADAGRDDAAPARTATGSRPAPRRDRPRDDAAARDDRPRDGARAGSAGPEAASRRAASPESGAPGAAPGRTAWPSAGPAAAASPAPGAPIRGSTRLGADALAAIRAPGRGLVALIAWPPIGLALALLYGELSGCARFAARCSDPASPWPWLIQLAVIGGFLLVPPLARLAAVGTYAIVIVVTPLTLFLATGAGYDPDRAANLMFFGLAIAWVGGVILGIARRRWRSRQPPPVP